MPFAASWIEERLLAAAAEKRLAHAYLLTGPDLDFLCRLFERLAALLLKSDNPRHPDLHIVRPESKSRRLTVAQIRDLEQELRLKAFQSEWKVAGIVAAERMCLSPAEAANAFLKTLEEPPDHTVIFLMTDRPEQLLPTIRSRCIVLPLEEGTPPAPKAEPWIQSWLTAKGTGADMAYRRAALLTEHWRELRETSQNAADSRENLDEDAAAAQMESAFLLKRDQSLKSLIHRIWEDSAQEETRLSAMKMVEALEELRFSLSRNIDQNLALECACLKISGLIND